jgi:hypothetical protein
MTLSNQSHFPAFFLSPESHLRGFFQILSVGKMENMTVKTITMPTNDNNTTECTGLCTVYRLSVTPENIVVQDKNNRRHFQQQCAEGALICTTLLQLCRIATLQEINGKEKEKRNRFDEYCKQYTFYSKISHAMTT